MTARSGVAWSTGWTFRRGSDWATNLAKRSAISSALAPAFGRNGTMKAIVAGLVCFSTVNITPPRSRTQ